MEKITFAVHFLHAFIAFVLILGCSKDDLTEVGLNSGTPTCDAAALKSKRIKSVLRKSKSISCPSNLSGSGSGSSGSGSDNGNGNGDGGGDDGGGDDGLPPGSKEIPIERVCGRPAIRPYYVQGYNKVYFLSQTNRDVVGEKELSTTLAKGVKLTVPANCGEIFFCKPSAVIDFHSAPGPEGTISNCLPNFWKRSAKGTGTSSNTGSKSPRTSDDVDLPETVPVFYKDHGGNYNAALTDPDCDLAIASPLVLDYDQSGIETVSIKNGIRFDHDRDGHKELSGWVKGSSPFLALDRNSDGSITSGNELFGSNTLLSNGSPAANGFEALKEYDQNRDGVIDSRDGVFSKLLLWFDKNQNGVSETAELLPLNRSKVTGISVKYTNVNEEDEYGNFTRQRGVFSLLGSGLGTILDIWFKVLE